MRESLFSPLWYRVAALAPLLGSDVIVRQQHSRGEPWYVLVGAATGRQCRINHSAYQFVGCCDGQHTVQEIWDALLQDLRDQAPNQDEVMQTLARLAEQGFLEYGAGPDIEAQAARQTRRRAQRRRANVNPLAFRIPLGDPSALLRRLDGVARLLFRPAVLALWLLALLLAVLAVASHWDALSAQATASMTSPRYLLLAWLSFPVIKLLHESGHALAVRHWGGEVHEVGISLFVLTPAPYVDASASAGFHRRYQRAGVAAMGIMVELALASLALALWLNLQPGPARDLAFVTAFVASVSTLLYNANPLLSFDGYYLLCDALDLPNLATRSRRYWIQLLQRAVHGSQAVTPMEVAPGEGKWLIVYAPASALYRIVLSGSIVLWVGQHSLALGLLITAYVAYSVLALPLLRTLRAVLAISSAAPSGWRARAVIGASATAALLALFVVPLPFHSAAWGVVWLPEQARVRVQTEGFVLSFAATDGEAVVADQLLLTMEDPVLLAQQAKLGAEVLQLRAQIFDALAHDTLGALNLQQDLARVQGDLRYAQQRVAQLEVRAQVAGKLVSPRQQDVIGSFVRRGTTLGYVLDRGEVDVRVAVPERDAALIREGHVGVEVRLAEDLGEPLQATMVRDVPAAGFELPSAALGDRGGGPYVSDPSDKEGLRSLEPVVLIDIAVPGRAIDRVGGRVWVRFDHGAQPLAVQLYRRLRQLFLQHFDATG